MVYIPTSKIEITKNGFSVLKKIIEMAKKHVYFASFLFYDRRVADLLMEKRLDVLLVES